MKACLGFAFFLITGILLNPCVAQTTAPAPGSAAVVEKAIPSVAMVLATRTAAETATSGVGTALVIRQDGVLLTAYHVIKEAYALQVRFKSGEVFDQVQLLGVDARRDVAAIRITASGLPVLPVVSAAQANVGEAVTSIAHPQALPWSVSTGVVSAYRLADEVPGSGSGYRILQFTAPTSAGSSGGVLLDSQGRALGLVVGSLAEGQNLNFAVPLESVIGLGDAAPGKTFANGSTLEPPYSAPAPGRAPAVAQAPGETMPNAPEKSDLLSGSKDPEFILRNFKTLYIDASGANFFGSDQMKAALVANTEFAGLKMRIVDDRKLADTVLIVSYTFAWDYPFELMHQNTSTLLLAGKGNGPFSGPAGATSVAKEFCKAARRYRVAPQEKKN